MSIETTYTRRNVQHAWLVHALTTSGVIVGYAGLEAVVEGHARAAILWLVAALLLDGIDGPIARKLDVGDRIPNLNGNSLDLIIDYFTCTIVPVAFLSQFDILPDNPPDPPVPHPLRQRAVDGPRRPGDSGRMVQRVPCRVEHDHPDAVPHRCQRLGEPRVCLVFCALTLSRVQFPHPVSVREHRAISLRSWSPGWFDDVAGHRPTRRSRGANRADRRPDVDDRAGGRTSPAPAEPTACRAGLSLILRWSRRGDDRGSRRRCPEARTPCVGRRRRAQQ